MPTARMARNLQLQTRNLEPGTQNTEREVRLGERHWHDHLFRSRRRANLLVSPQIRDRYLHPPRRPWFPLELMFRLAGDLRGRRVLVFGCGDAYTTVLLALAGAEVYAFDLSAEAIATQQAMARANGVAHRVRLLVAAAEQLPFAGQSFDLVFGSAILHHIPAHLDALPAELERILDQRGDRRGCALFAEPVLRSPVLKLIKSLPWRQALSPGERQLNDGDLRLLRRRFHLEQTPFCLLARLDRFILKGPLEDSSVWIRAVIRCFHGLDFVLLRLPGFRRLAGVEVMKLTPGSERVPASGA